MMVLKFHYVSQECDLMSEKDALLEITIQFLPFKDLNHLLEMADMLIFYLAIDQDISKIRNNKSAYKGPEHMVHKPHESNGCIG